MTKLDLNLLLVFEALMTEQNVSRAAQRLGRSQPAVSQSLARLRDWFADALFVRTPQGLAPTPRARQVWAECQEPLNRLRETFDQRRFDPRASRLKMTFGAAEDVEFVLLPGIMEALGRDLYDASFDVQPTDWQSVTDDLFRGRCDVAFTISGAVPNGICKETLIKAGFSCLYDPALVTPTAPHEQWYVDAEHLVVTFSDGRPTFIADYFENAQRLRRCRISTRAILATPHYVQGSHLVATMPTPLAQLFVRLHPLAMVPLPIDAKMIDYSMLWVEKRTQDPAFRWVLERIRRWAAERSEPAA